MNAKLRKRVMRSLFVCADAIRRAGDGLDDGDAELPAEEHYSEGQIYLAVEGMRMALDHMADSRREQYGSSAVTCCPLCGWPVVRQPNSEAQTDVDQLLYKLEDDFLQISHDSLSLMRAYSISPVTVATFEKRFLAIFSRVEAALHIVHKTRGQF